MASPTGALVDLVGPFLIPVVLFALGVAGYGLLLALGRLGVVDDGSDRFRPAEGGTDGRSDGSPDRSGTDGADATDRHDGDGDASDGRRL